MEIAPIPNLVSIRIAAPSAAPTEVPTTRAIDLRRQQDQDDAYTPGNSEDENDHPNDEPERSVVEAAQAVRNESLGDVPPESTISFFA